MRLVTCRSFTPACGYACRLSLTRRSGSTRYSSSTSNAAANQNMASHRNAVQIGVAALMGGGLFYVLYANGYVQPLPATHLRSVGTSDGRKWPNVAATLAAKRKTLAQLETQAEAIEEKEIEIAKESAREVTTASVPAQAWDAIANNYALARDSITSLEWPSFPDNLADYIVPEWVRVLPAYVSKLQAEVSMEPGFLASEIWSESEDPDVNPEILWDAKVRVSNELCDEEKAFLEKRRAFTRTALAKYLGIPDEKVHPDDVPTIAMCSSGGGLRALVAGAGSYLAATDAGLFDCATYTAGVSGSCWLLSLFYSSLAGQRCERLIDHLKSRLGIHIAFPPAALALLTTAPTNKYLLRGPVEKLQGDPDGDFGLVGIYGLLLAARLLVPRGELDVKTEDLRISNQRAYVDDGRNPMPIYCAVRHEIPLDETITGTERSSGGPSEVTKEIAKQESWFQWFEFSPYELWCEELDAGIPAWAVGRHFQDGKNIPRESGLGLPELKLPLMLGIWGSAFCATLSHYFKEVRPVFRNMIGFGGLDEMIEARNDQYIKIHPIDPASIPNYVLGMRHQLPSTCPESIFKENHMKLMDAGMSNNLPIYPLLRPGRNVDILIAFDASADIKTENWLSQVDGYARQREIKGWPIGAGWPKNSAKANAEQMESAQATSAEDAAEKLAKAQDDDTAQPKTAKGLQQKREAEEDLGPCTIWVGSTEERRDQDEPPRSKRVEEGKELMEPDAGIAVVYFPYIPNEKVAGVDPDTSDFMSTWNFVYTPEQVDKAVNLARANFGDGREKTRKTVRAVYERKRNARLQKEEQERKERWHKKLRLGTLGRKGHGDHGDHFS